jgi:hypothetical protein
MEDLTATVSIFTKEELAAQARHIIIFRVEAILKLRDEVDSLAKDRCAATRLNHGELLAKARGNISAMRDIWSEFGPARVLARRLYPADEALFDVLDNSLMVESAIYALCDGKEITKDDTCSFVCCLPH